MDCRSGSRHLAMTQVKLVTAQAPKERKSVMAHIKRVNNEQLFCHASVGWHPGENMKNYYFYLMASKRKQTFD